jgi:SepF-like predicted cell division protein (DUF552 family)
MLGKKAPRAERAFLDLDSVAQGPQEPAPRRIKVVEVMAREDLRAVSDMAYGGSVVVLDFSRFADGDAAKREFAEHLSGAARDAGGSFSEASDRIMVFGPAGWGIDRCRISHGVRRS